MDAWNPDELKTRLDQGERIFLKLWKKGCGICKLSTPATERMERENKHEMVFGKISIDEHPEMLEIAGTDMLPIFFVFDKGKKRGQFAGFKGVDKLEDFVKTSLQS